MLQRRRSRRIGGRRGGRGLVALTVAAAATFLASASPASAAVAARRSLSLLPPPPKLPGAPRLPPLSSTTTTTTSSSASSSSPKEKKIDDGARTSSSSSHDAEENYGHFADLLASVLVLREGGISEAIDALPLLHDTTHAYVRTLSILQEQSTSSTNGNSNGNNNNPIAGAVSKWKGLSDSAALAIARGIPPTSKYLNYTDPLAQSGQQIQEAIDAKWGPEPALGWQRQWKFQQLNHTLSKIVPDSSQATAADDAVIAELNDKLSQYNIEVSRKHIMPPTRFENAAAVISKNIAGIHLMQSTFTFAPCLISIHAAPVMVHGTAVNVAPSAIGVMASGAMSWNQGVNVQVRLFLLFLFAFNVSCFVSSC